MARRRNQSCQRPLRRCIFNTFHFIEREKLRGINCVLNSFPITKAMLMVNTELLLDRCRPGATSVEKRTEWPLRLLPLLFPLFFIPLGEKREGEVRGQGTEYYCQLFKNSVSVGYMVFVLLSYIYLLRGFPSSSAGKESTCNAGDPGSLGWEGICYPLVFLGFPGGSDGKESTCSVGDLGSSPGLASSLEGGHGNPLLYSCLENPHGQRNLQRYSPTRQKESDTTERLRAAPHTFCMSYIF